MLYIGKFNRFILISLALLVLSFSSAIAGGLSPCGDIVFGDDSVTLDSETGLDWLDLRLSLNRSYDDLTGADGTNEFAVGGDFEGWGYATRIQVDQLFVNAGVRDALGGGAIVYSPVNGATDAAYFEFQELIGITSLSSFRGFDSYGTRGITGDKASANTLYGSSVQRDFLDGVFYGADSRVGSYGYPTAIGDKYNASWLIRESAVSAVPVPAAIWLFGTALIGLVGFGKRKNRIAA